MVLLLFVCLGLIRIATQLTYEIVVRSVLINGSEPRFAVLSRCIALPPQLASRCELRDIRRSSKVDMLKVVPNHSELFSE